MKFSLLVALTHHAKLLILDEPTSGLDPVFRNDFLELLEELVKKEKLSVLFSTHIISDLEKIADSITYIKDGKIEFSKDRDKLLEEYYYVKGPNTSLTAELKNRISNYKGNEFGFSGMIRKAEINNKEDFNEVIFEPPTIEDIILCIEKEEER